MERGSESAEYAADVCATLADLIRDKSRELHEQDLGSETASALVDDLRSVSGWLMGHDGDPWSSVVAERTPYPWDASPARWEEFLRWGTPIDFDPPYRDQYGDEDICPPELRPPAPEDQVSYFRPAWRETDRDRWMLAYAALCVFGVYVSERAGQDATDPHQVWDVVAELGAELWLSPTDTREIDTMRRALRALLDARFTRTEPARDQQDQQQDQDEEETVNRTIGALTLASQVGAHVMAGDYGQALATAEQGKREFGDMKPGGYTWDKLIADVRAATPAPAPEQESAPDQVAHEIAAMEADGILPAGKQATAPAPVAASVPASTVAAAEQAQKYLVRLAHNYTDGTRILDADTAAGKLISETIGRRSALPKDQQWGWSRGDEGASFWYPKTATRNGCANDEIVRRAVTLLEGTGKFMIIVDIDNLGPDGKPAGAPAPRVSKAQQARTARLASKMLDTLAFYLSPELSPKVGAACEFAGCGATGLRVDGAIILKRPDGMPYAACRSHDESAPALRAELVAEMGRMADEYHQREDEQAGTAKPAQPVAPKTTRKATSAPKATTKATTRPTPAVASAPTDATPYIQTVPDEILFTLAAKGDADATAEVLRRMKGGAVATAPAAPVAPKATTARTAAPAKPAPALVPSDGPLLYAFDLEPGASPRHTRHELNVSLNLAVVVGFRRKGADPVTYAVRIDRETRTGIVVVNVPDREVPIDREKLHRRVVRTVTAVRGVDVDSFVATEARDLDDTRAALLESLASA
jgi:hypothetical protein